MPLKIHDLEVHLQLLIRQLVNSISYRMWKPLPAETATEQQLPNKEEILQSLPVDAVSFSPSKTL